MKHTFSKFGLLGLCLLLSIFVVKSVVNAADADVTIDRFYPAKVWYRSVLHTLSLGEFGGTITTLSATSGKLKFNNGIVVGQDPSVGNSNYAVIGGGKNNKIENNVDYAGIGGGEGNKAQGKYAVIGGGSSNTAGGENAVVAGGNNNTAAGGSVVVGGQSNKALGGGIVLGGKNNTGNPNSLALGQNSTSNEGSFAWRGNAGDDAGYINAPAGTLIGTTTPIAGVNLVVNGPVKVEGNEDAGVYGEIRYVGGCFYGFDGSKWHVMNRGNDKNNNDECGAFSTTTAKYCEFGNTILWDGDTATGYSRPYATNCNSYRNTKVTCNAGILSPAGYTYPYCYTIQAN